MLEIRPHIAAALMANRAVVALESTLIAHGLPWPLNVETARAAEATIRAQGAEPATIAVRGGRAVVGLSDAEVEELARGQDVLKASRRDLAAALMQGRTAATTVAATMFLAHRAGIPFFATGGIGGVHRGCSESWDISADLGELARTPVAVVCAGAKSVLDLPRTLEVLESLSVPVLGYQTATLPAFYLRSSGLPTSARVDSADEAARIIAAHWTLGGAGVVVAQALPENEALDPEELETATRRAESDAQEAGIRGPARTPFLLTRLAELTSGNTLRANQSLIIVNARLAAEVALAFGAGTNGQKHPE